MKAKINPDPQHWDRIFATPGILGIITTVDEEDRVNAGVFATIVRASHNPVQISFVTYTNKTHTHLNIQKTKQFVVNLVQFERTLLEKLCIVGLEFPAGVNELEKAQLTQLPSTVVKPPRIGECNRHFECELVWMKEWIDRVVIVGNVVAASVDQDLADENGFIDFDLANQALYCGAPYFNQPPFKHQFVGAKETMAADTPWEGPEIAQYRKKIDDLKI